MARVDIVALQQVEAVVGWNLRVAQVAKRRGCTKYPVRMNDAGTVGTGNNYCPVKTGLNLTKVLR